MYSTDQIEMIDESVRWLTGAFGVAFSVGFGLGSLIMWLSIKLKNKGE